MSYRIYGSSGSPYSIKVRSYFRYKDIDHVWLVRNSPERFEEHKKYSKLPIVPTVITPEGKGIQDSTPIMEEMEALLPEPSVHPPDAAMRFISELLEEFADEWGNKWMMHYRWYAAKAPTVDAEAYARRIAAELKSGSPLNTAEVLQDQLEVLGKGFKERMLGRGFTVGSNQQTAAIIEQSFLDTIILLEAHLLTRPFIFGRSPSFGDFGLYGQLYQMLCDVTAGELMRLHTPNVALWAERMGNPRAVLGGGFETWNTLASTLEPLLSSQISLFLKWSDANSKALAAGSKYFSIDLAHGHTWTQSVGGPQRYHAKSLKEIRRKFAAVATAPGLADIMARSGCLDLLQEVATSKL
eukprot:TRINITY_DN54698_c0_g1_i1.p1 TRINITY_DN54698_c0_g1~~TRINITY_DN54698_c0_g1_i1.p1  ORF type:complete len:354 (+),score=26.98 TRINITY_DN54698_c0_g1_i1:60-1121(+)